MVKRNVVIILAVVVLSIGAYYYISIPAELVDDREILTNISELYSHFTYYMKDNVDYRLSTVDCYPSKYYYDQDNFCFICDGFDTCFGYSWINRPGGKEMNPAGYIYLDGVYSKETSLNFNSYGLFEIFGCECNGDCTCDDNITVESTDNNIVFSFPQGSDMEGIIEKNMDDSLMNYEINNNVLYCDYFDARMISNELIV